MKPTMPKNRYEISSIDLEYDSKYLVFRALAIETQQGISRIFVKKL